MIESDLLYARTMRQLRKQRDANELRIAVRKQKLRMRFRNRLDAEIARTEEKLVLLKGIKEELNATRA